MNRPCFRSAAVLLAAVLALAACGDKPQPPQAAPDKLFKEQRDALDQAKGVEQTLSKEAEKNKQEADKQAQ